MNYTPVTLVHVSLATAGPMRKVGRLAWKDRRIYFEYAAEFLQSRLEISPFKLPLAPGVMTCAEPLFDGLFGVFNDSLPDGWGRLLLDRHVRRHGIAPELLTPLDRLTHVGSAAMGALCYEPDASEPTTFGTRMHLDELAAETQHVLNNDIAEDLSTLLALAGSSAGARPKVMVGVSPNKRRIVPGHAALPPDYASWMVKFPAANDLADIGAVEFAYSMMARAAGLDMMPTHLFPAKHSAGYFGVQRFDRHQGARVHVHTLSGLLHTDHRFPSLDYEQVLRATLALTRDVQEVQKHFRLAAFNVLAHNRDDHAKNIAFLMRADGTWVCAPAYDLTFSRGPGGEQSTTVLGEGKAPGIAHLRTLAEKFGLTEAQMTEIISTVSDAVAAWPKWAKRAGVSAASRQMIQRALRAIG